ncbi:hypothetical protein K503DRAFT_311147 [Rhizopogon vinicolor AM-OR11-026]|uniref:Uncharacterized protein n=1 Tax=Rhizopogon vinicolor AM-OR11-026 TaxID=1314800 RepID=A0A1B7MUW1_9AGAM|nr:hypothetical protein K503DRAFT_311147 [Rhizopogon vinicolor AM-OR11-026]
MWQQGAFKYGEAVPAARQQHSPVRMRLHRFKRAPSIANLFVSAHSHSTFSHLPVDTLTGLIWYLLARFGVSKQNGKERIFATSAAICTHLCYGMISILLNSRSFLPISTFTLWRFSSLSSHRPCDLTNNEPSIDAQPSRNLGAEHRFRIQVYKGPLEALTSPIIHAGTLTSVASDFNLSTAASSPKSAHS